MYGDKNDREDVDNNVHPHAAEEAHFSSVSSFPRPEQVCLPGPNEPQDNYEEETDIHLQQHMRTASTPMTPPPIYLCDFICGVPLLHILTQIVMGKAFDQTTTWPTMLLFSIWLACAINWYYWRLAMWLALGTWHR